MTVAELSELIRDVPDFPRPGILFKDITTLLKDGPAFRRVIELLAEQVDGAQFDAVVGMESRGFIFGAPLAYLLNTGFVPVRKHGKLPSATIRTDYELEYGTNSLELHSDALDAGSRVLVVDDLLATGGTVTATIELVERLGATVSACAFVVELTALRGRERLNGRRVHSLIRF